MRSKSTSQNDSLAFDFSESEHGKPISKYMRDKLHLHGPRYNDYARKYPKASDSRSRVHRIWRCMQMRCLQPSHAAYERYGGRGITICPEWMFYDGFRLWALSSGYADNLTLDRKDNDKGYEPDNCRWSTLKEQQNNKRATVLYTGYGETKNASDWFKDPRRKVCRAVMDRRLIAGWSVETAITVPAERDCSKKRKTMLTAFGETKHIFDWAKDSRCIITVATIRERMRGRYSVWQPEELLTTPADYGNGRRHFTQT